MWGIQRVRGETRGSPWDQTNWADSLMPLCTLETVSDVCVKCKVFSSPLFSALIFVSCSYCSDYIFTLDTENFDWFLPHFWFSAPVFVCSRVRIPAGIIPNPNPASSPTVSSISMSLSSFVSSRDNPPLHHGILRGTRQAFSLGAKMSCF